MANWRALAAKLDASVDRTWGDKIRITPWAGGSYSAGAHDTTRPILEGVGTILTSEPDVGVGGGPVGGSEFRTRVSEQALRLECSSTFIRSARARQGDHVDQLDDDGETIIENFQIVSIVHDRTGRAVVNLSVL